MRMKQNGEESHDDLKQNYINKSNETLYSINIYITDARIQTEIKNILYYYKIISQDYEINDKPHVNLIEFKTNTNRKSDLFKGIKDGVEEIVSFNLVARGINKVEEGNEIYIKIMDNYGLS